MYRLSSGRGSVPRDSTRCWSYLTASSWAKTLSRLILACPSMLDTLPPGLREGRVGGGKYALRRVLESTYSGFIYPLPIPREGLDFSARFCFANGGFVEVIVELGFVQFPPFSTTLTLFESGDADRSDCSGESVRLLHVHSAK